MDALFKGEPTGKVPVPNLASLARTPGCCSGTSAGSTYLNHSRLNSPPPKGRGLSARVEKNQGRVAGAAQTVTGALLLLPSPPAIAPSPLRLVE